MEAKDICRPPGALLYSDPSIFPNPLPASRIDKAYFQNLVFPMPTYNELSPNNHNKQNKSRIKPPKNPKNAIFRYLPQTKTPFHGKYLDS